MKKLFVFALSICLLFLPLTPTFAEQVDYDYFESWTNTEVANNWTSATVGSPTGGGFNQVYAAGQGISCGGDGTNYKAVYRDAAARAPYFYLAQVEAISNSTNAAGELDGSYVRMILQFRDTNGNVLKTALTTGYELSPVTWRPMRVSGYAPDGTSSVRLILQVLGGQGGGTVFKNLKLYEMPFTESPATLLYESFTRNWQNSNVAPGWTAVSYGGGPGDFEMRATGGSAQGISTGGSATSYRQISRTYTAQAGYIYQAAVEVVSNSMDENGNVDPSKVVVYMEFLNEAGTVLATYAMDGKQSNIKPAEGTTILVQANSPQDTAKVRITLRVFGGAGGGTVFDNFGLTKD